METRCCGTEMSFDGFDYDCGWCDAVREEVVSRFRGLPDGRLLQMARMSGVIPRRLFFGESMEEAVVREYVSLAVESGIRGRLPEVGCVVVEEEG